MVTYAFLVLRDWTGVRGSMAHSLFCSSRLGCEMFWEKNVLGELKGVIIIAREQLMRMG